MMGSLRMMFPYTRLLYPCKTEASVLFQSSERQLLEESGAAQAQEIGSEVGSTKSIISTSRECIWGYFQDIVKNYTN